MPEDIGTVREENLTAESHEVATWTEEDAVMSGGAEAIKPQVPGFIHYVTAVVGSYGHKQFSGVLRIHRNGKSFSTYIHGAGNLSLNYPLKFPSGSDVRATLEDSGDDSVETRVSIMGYSRRE